MVTFRMAHAGSSSPCSPADPPATYSRGELSRETGDGLRGVQEPQQPAGTLGSPSFLCPVERDFFQDCWTGAGSRPDSSSEKHLLPFAQHSMEKSPNLSFKALLKPHQGPLWPEGDPQSQEKGSSDATQALFQASIFQAQQCILDLQGAIDQQTGPSKSCSLVPERRHEMPPSQEPPILVLDSGSSDTQDEEGDSLEEDDEDEEYLFYNNPLFQEVPDPTETISSEGSTLWSHPGEASMEDEEGILDDSWVSGKQDDDEDNRAAFCPACVSINPAASHSDTEQNLCSSLSSSPVPSYVPHYRSLSPLVITEGDCEGICSLMESLEVPDSFPDQLVPNPSRSTWGHVPPGANHGVDLPAQGLLFSASSSSLASALLQEPPESRPSPAEISWAPSSSLAPAAPIAVQSLWQEESRPQAPFRCHPLPSCAWVGEPQTTSCQQKEVAAPDLHPVSLGGVERKLESSAEGLEMVEVPTVHDDEALEEEVEKMDPTPHCPKEPNFQARDRGEGPEAEKPMGPGGSVHSNGTLGDWAAASRLATRLYRLDGFRRSQVATFLRKNNDFSQMVAEAYLSFFHFGKQTLDQALRSFLKAFVLTGETQERERILRHFAQRYHSCNPEAFLSPDAVHTLTCAVMLLNTDLHGKNIGRSMSCQDFVTNLDGLNEGKNFPKELLKAMYYSIRHEKLEWAGGEEELPDSPSLPPAAFNQKKSNPFLTLTRDPDAKVYQQGLLARKVHAEADGKKTPWGKRGWKTFHTVLKGTVLYFLKDEGAWDASGSEEAIGVHHALAEAASRYTKRSHVFRLQTADWCVFLFQATTAEEMNSWISRINLVAAMFSSPPFPAAVGSQKKFVRPILPTAPCKNSLEDQHLAHEEWMDKVSSELLEHQQSLPSKRSRGRDLEDYQLRKEFLLHEKRRYETYVKLLEVKLNSATENLDEWEAQLRDAEESCPALHKSHSSPSLNMEELPAAAKVKRNISERRTVRKIIPRRNKHLL